jgi:dephospho-CoA kinase
MEKDYSEPMSTEVMRTCKIGVTGTIGSGKSLVGRILAEQNIPVLDVDDVVHNLLDTSKEVQTAIAKRFGDDVLMDDGSGSNGKRVDRARLGKIVFHDENDRRDLEKIVHPAVLQYSEQWIEEEGSPIAAVLIPLLFESGNPKRFAQVWSVSCHESILRARLKERSKLSSAEIDKRLAAQMSQEEKASLADCVIDNSGTVDETRRQVLSLLIEVQQTIGLPVIDPRHIVGPACSEDKTQTLQDA